MQYKLLLASRSPRRRELIKCISEFTGCPFETFSVDADESVDGSLLPRTVAEQVAEKKADAFLAVHELSPDEIVISADTLVACVVGGGDAPAFEILGKPKDDDDARRMLRMLSGNNHNVFTGVSLVYFKEGAVIKETFSVDTEVHVDPISEEDIEKYIATGEHRDKAGAYAIQGPFSVHIDRISGEYNNVVGLPVAEIYRRIKNIISGNTSV